MRRRQSRSDTPSSNERPAAQLSMGSLMMSFVLGLGVTLVCWYSLLTHSSLSESDFELVQATPASVQLAFSRKQPFVDIRLPDDPIHYRVPVERLKDFDNPQGFVQAASRPGARLSFHIRRGARENPERPRLNPEPTVFIDSMEVDSHLFYALSQRIAWNERNKSWMLVIAVLFPALTAYVGYQLWRRRAELERTPPPPVEAPPQRTRARRTRTKEPQPRKRW